MKKHSPIRKPVWQAIWSSREKKTDDIVETLDFTSYEIRIVLVAIRYKDLCVALIV